jgi:integrase
VALTDATARKAKAGEKPYKLFDSLGLYLYVTPAGGKSWRMKYRYANKEKRLSFGLYPEVPLSEARDRRDAARRLLRENRDPGLEVKRARAAGQAAAELTFERFAREWQATQLPRWSDRYGALVLRQLENDVLPHLGPLPVADIDAPLVLATLRRIEKRGSIETAKRIRQHISGVFSFAIGEGAVGSDPAASVARALKPKPKSKQRPALTDLDQLHELIAKVDGSTANVVTKLASRFLALTAVRPGVLRAMPWSEVEGIDWEDQRLGPDNAIWRIPAARMKLDVEKKGETAFDHIVPLPRQAVETLRAVRRITGRAKMVFPHTAYSHRPMSENTINEAYKDAGYKGRHVAHGWRSSFSTIMNERSERLNRPGDRAVVDLMLAHQLKGHSSSEGAYMRAGFMPRRRELAQIWADLILPGEIGSLSVRRSFDI